jgi:TonB family protein
MNIGSWNLVMAHGIVFLLLSVGATAQLREERPNYPDEIVPIRGKPFRGKILKFEGTTLYLEVTKHKIAQIITIDVDSLLEVTKDFGPTKITIWQRKPRAEQRRTAGNVPTIKLPKNFGVSTKRDSVAALAVERDSIYVGAVDRKDTAAAQSALVDQKPVPLVRANTEYPPGAASRRLEGAVILRLWIDKDGLPKKHQVVQSSDPIFVESSVASVMNWEFSPATVKGTPIGVWASVTFEYKIQR